VIQQLRNIHAMLDIALVGSGPTALDYNPAHHDLGIAINGAIQLADAIANAFEYLIMFDTSLPHKPWFKDHPEVQRILGYELAKMFTPPEDAIIFQYIERNMVVDPRSLTELSAVDNIGIPALETAAIMGPRKITIYGIDMARRDYFYGGGKGVYGNNGRTVSYMNELIALLHNTGTEIVIKGSPSCKLHLPGRTSYEA